MLTELFYLRLAVLIKGEVPAPPALYVAVGAGDPDWDRNPPLLLRSTMRLTNELGRKPVAAQDIHFLDAADADVEAPSPRLRVRVRFEEGEATGTLREVGLFANAGAARDSGALLSYFVHAPIEKTLATSLERSLRLDLMPRAAGGVQPTRYLGNSNSREVHDMENLSAACQTNEIRFDRRIYFATPEQAIEFGYDRCAFCFGRALSDR